MKPFKNTISNKLKFREKRG